MRTKAMQYESVLEVILRAATWIVIVAYDLVATSLLHYAQPGSGYYVLAFALTVALIPMLRRLGNVPLIWDLEDICVYDAIIQIVGLWIFLNSKSINIYLTLAFAVFFWKNLRIIWVAKVPDQSGFASWPVIGVRSYWMRRKSNGILQTNNPHWVYFALALSIPAGYLYATNYKTAGTIFLYTPPIILILLYVRNVISYFRRNEIARIAAIEDRIAAENAAAIAKIDAQMAKREAEYATERLKDQQVIEAQNVELAERNRQLADTVDELNRRNAELQTLYDERDALAQRLAARNDRLKDSTHDLKYTMVAMSFKVQTLKDTHLDDTQRDLANWLAEEIQIVSKRLVIIVNSAKITNDLPSLRTQGPIPVRHLCEYFFTRFNDQAREYGVSLGCRYPKLDTNLAIETDGETVKRIIANLLTNAVTYTDPDGDVRLTFTRTSHGCFVHVYDSGIGMAGFDGPDRLANFHNLIERLAKEEGKDPQGSRTEMVEGNGVGLLNVSRLCKDLGIEIKMRSVLGRGTDFCLKLPIAVRNH